VVTVTETTIRHGARQRCKRRRQILRRLLGLEIGQTRLMNKLTGMRNLESGVIRGGRPKCKRPGQILLWLPGRGIREIVTATTRGRGVKRTTHGIHPRCKRLGQILRWLPTQKIGLKTPGRLHHPLRLGLTQQPTPMRPPAGRLMLPRVLMEPLQQPRLG
jgi:hypothetical protein